MWQAQEADPTNLEVLLALGVSHTNGKRCIIYVLWSCFYLFLLTSCNSPHFFDEKVIHHIALVLYRCAYAHAYATRHNLSNKGVTYLRPLAGSRSDPTTSGLNTHFFNKKELKKRIIENKKTWTTKMMAKKEMNLILLIRCVNIQMRYFD